MSTTPRSRRERPAKPPLSKTAIVAATIAIIRDEGLEKATMRRVAQALDTGPASLYVYVANTAELRSVVLDELTGTLPADQPGRWEQRLEALLQAYGEVLLRYPGLARSALVLRPMGSNTIALVDRLLGLLLEGGIAAEQAAWGVDLLMQLVTAAAAEHSPPTGEDIDSRSSAEKLVALESLLREADPSQAPHVTAHVDALMSGTPAGRMAWAIRALVAGIAVTPTTAISS